MYPICIRELQPVSQVCILVVVSCISSSSGGLVRREAEPYGYGLHGGHHRYQVYPGYGGYHGGYHGGYPVGYGSAGFVKKHAYAGVHDVHSPTHDVHTAEHDVHNVDDVHHVHDDTQGRSENGDYNAEMKNKSENGDYHSEGADDYAKEIEELIF